MKQSRVRWTVLALAVAAAILAGANWRADRAGRVPPTVSEVPMATADPLAVLRQWDRRRAQAWAQGDPEALATLYVPGSTAGERDLAMLRRYVDRGLRVQGMAVQLVEARVIRHDAALLLLRVTDRVVGAVAVGNGVHQWLPRDRATTRILELQRSNGRWRMSVVHPS